MLKFKMIPDPKEEFDAQRARKRERELQRLYDSLTSNPGVWHQLQEELHVGHVADELREAGVHVQLRDGSGLQINPANNSIRYNKMEIVVPEK